MICYGQFNTKIARRANMLTDEMMDGLSALVYCRPLDTTTLRELIDSNGRMGHMEIRQGELERMSRRQLYHSDRYAGLFEYMAGTAMFHCREPTYHPVMMSHNSNNRMRSSVVMTHFNLVTVFRSQV
ncbi:hypothetical protein Tco_0796881 [Tanacetum coccineum]